MTLKIRDETFLLKSGFPTFLKQKIGSWDLCKSAIKMGEGG
jgi:hypothetical protein